MDALGSKPDPPKNEGVQKGAEEDPFAAVLSIP